MEKKREKMERYYMGKEDVKVVAATLTPPSSDSTFPSFPSFAPSHMELGLARSMHCLPSKLGKLFQ